RMGIIGSLFSGTPGQSGKAFFFENEGNIGGAERLALVVEDSLDVINGKVLLAGPNNLFAQGIGFGSLLRAFSRGEEERPGGILSKLMNQDAKAPRRIAEAAGGLLGGELLDEEGAQGFVLAVCGVGWPEEDLSEVG